MHLDKYVKIWCVMFIPRYIYYSTGPITEEDNIISVSGLDSSDSDMIIVEDYEEKVSALKKGLLPDPRIMIPQTLNMDIFDSDIFICAFMKSGKYIFTGKPAYTEPLWDEPLCSE